MPSGGGAGVGPAMKVMQLTLKERVTIDRLVRQNKVSATAKDVVGSARIDLTIWFSVML